jgi:two-component system cell cycle sensor histidine kinase/response regulator CckA
MKSDLFLFLENTGWPVLLAEEGVIRRCNQAALDVFGEVLQDEKSLLASLWSPENGTTAEQFLEREERLASPVPLKFKVKNGTTVGFNTFTSTIMWNGKKNIIFQLFSGSTVDSSTIHKQKLDCALQLARSVALDFNNALTSILGHTSLILGKMEANHPWRASLLEVEKSAAKAAEIASDLAGFSRQEKEARVQIAGNLNALLQRTVEVFRTPERSKIAWSLQFERKLFSAVFDEAKMQQAFVKILENAVEALGSDGRISVLTRNLELSEGTQDRTAKLSAGAYVCIEISDTGSGIEAEVLPRVFEPFFTTKNTNKHRGLGLAWVYGIITNHGGGVAISSQIGNGTSVRVYLPANKKLVKDVSVDIADFSGNQKILFVDDEDLLLTMGQMILSSYGYEVLTANSGKKALDIFSKTQKPIDLLITDLVMPNMSGRELMEQVRRISPDTRIICSSGFIRASSADENDAYLQKPFTAQELLRKVKQMLSSDS